jgi:hypothetical protein
MRVWLVSIRFALTALAMPNTGNGKARQGRAQRKGIYFSMAGRPHRPPTL